MTTRDGIDSPHSEYDPAPYRQARADVRELIERPLRAWKTCPATRKRARLYRSLLSLPLDLASAGYVITVATSDAGWKIEATMELQPGRTVRFGGQAQSYAACLSQMTYTGPRAIADLEQRAKWGEPELTPVHELAPDEWEAPVARTAG